LQRRIAGGERRHGYFYAHVEVGQRGAKGKRQIHEWKGARPHLLLAVAKGTLGGATTGRGPARRKRAKVKRQREVEEGLLSAVIAREHLFVIRRRHVVHGYDDYSVAAADGARGPESALPPIAESTSANERVYLLLTSEKPPLAACDDDDFESALAS